MASGFIREYTIKFCFFNFYLNILSNTNNIVSIFSFFHLLLVWEMCLWIVMQSCYWCLKIFCTIQENYFCLMNFHFNHGHEWQALVYLNRLILKIVFQYTLYFHLLFWCLKDIKLDTDSDVYLYLFHRSIHLICLYEERCFCKFVFNVFPIPFY